MQQAGCTANSCHLFWHADAKTCDPSPLQRQDGSTGARFEVTAQTVKFLGSEGEVEREEHGDEAEEDI